MKVRPLASHAPKDWPATPWKSIADRAVGQALVAVTPGDLPREHPADRAVGVRYGLLEADLFAVFECRQALLDQLVVQGFLEPVILVLGVADRLSFRCLDPVEQRREIHAAGLPVLDGPAHLEPVGASDHLLEGPEAHPRHVLPHLFGDEEEVVDDVLGRTGKALSELGVLGRDTNGAGVQMAYAHHDAARGHERRRREGEVLGPEERRHGDVASRLELAVGLQDHTPPQPVLDEHLLGLGDPELPRQPRVLYGRERRGARPAVVARDGYVVGLRFRHACRDRPDPDLGDELHAYPGPWVGVLQVVDELRQVLDRVDVVVGRR